ncbi:MAG TPA: type II secretion system protein [Phycisphaerae bacterium]|nr:type II secretion system protein [Phycisphaerae bacterium]
MSRRRRPTLASCGRAFTLIELLVVVSIIALLMAILLPSLKKARDQAKDTVCRSNMHQLGLAIGYYTTENRDRLPWVKGTKNPDVPQVPGADPRAVFSNAPYAQYHQLFHLLPYMKELNIFTCPQANSGVVAGHRAGWGPRSVLGYLAPGEIGSGYRIPSYYRVRRTDSLWKTKRAELFGSVPLGGPAYVDELYTEYWFNDWSVGASVDGFEVPPINGGLINRITYPAISVMMADTANWNPRHRGGSHFLFTDAHVDWTKSERYFDPEGHERGTRKYAKALDKDAFGNRPYWAWGLGTGRKPVNGDM